MRQKGLRTGRNKRSSVQKRDLVVDYRLHVASRDKISIDFITLFFVLASPLTSLLSTSKK
jgi:hypothetical protein